MPRASIEPAASWPLVPQHEDQAACLVQLPDAVAAAIARHGEAAYPGEACGALIGTGDGAITMWRITRAMMTANHDDHRHRYVIDPRSQLAAERSAAHDGEEVVGYYHSHPDAAAVPSALDREHAWPGYLYLVCSVVQAQAVRLGGYTLAAAGGAFREVRWHRPSAPSPGERR